MSIESLPIALTFLSIRDFRGIDQLSLDFRGPDGLPNRLVVVAGPNGCGKTAVLEAGLLACGGHALMTGARGPAANRLKKKSYEVSAKFLRHGQAMTVTDKPGDPAPVPDPAIPHLYFSSWRYPKLVGAVNITQRRPGRKSAKTDSNRLKLVKEALVNAAAVDWFHDSAHQPFFFDNNELRSTQPRTGMDLINRGWSEFYPENPAKFQVDLNRDDSSEGGSFDVVFMTQASRPMSVDHLSAGQLEIFLMLATLALNDDQEGIVFIDEPELHLDPQWHRPLLKSLMRVQPHAQFVVATHSPEIYDAARSYERHFLVSDDDPRARIWDEVRVVEAGA